MHFDTSNTYTWPLTLLAQKLDFNRKTTSNYFHERKGNHN